MTPDLASLVGARICHDLISPIGAISNGVELIGMTQGTNGAEMALINDSVHNANARIMFFRLAFGAATPDQLVSQNEVQQILSAMSNAGRICYHWKIDERQPRLEVRAAFLLIQCVESAMPRGGDITISKHNGTWHCLGQAPEVRVEEPLWDSLTNQFANVEHTASHVQFALLPKALTDAGLTLNTTHSPTELSAEMA